MVGAREIRGHAEADHPFFVGRQRVGYIGQPEEDGVRQEVPAQDERGDARLPAKAHGVRLAPHRPGVAVVLMRADARDLLQDAVARHPRLDIPVLEAVGDQGGGVGPEEDVEEVIRVPAQEGPGERERPAAGRRQGPIGVPLAGGGALELVHLIRDEQVKDPAEMPLDELGRRIPAGPLGSGPKAGSPQAGQKVCVRRS